MKLLLDTHVFLWYITGDQQLPVSWRQAVQDPANDVFLSVASVWEAVIKYALGKLPLPEPPAVFLPRQREAHQLTSLPVDEGALIPLSNLPPIHRDPFDRILIAQTLQHGLTLVTADEAIRGYAVVCLG
jgi:PIN domain nuclease of toxin-antitoxin system